LQEKNTSKSVITEFINLFDELAGVLGLKLHKEEELLDEQIEALIEERNQARKEKNFARADEIRDLLKEQNIILEDTAQGVRWKRDK
jgi:cysteinyl-tRNA synthetase